jgi:hypothetical protein
MICEQRDIDKVLKVVGEKDAEGRDLREIFYHALGHDSVRIIMPTDDTLAMFVDFNGKEWDAHFIGSRDTAWMAIKWMFEHEDCEAVSWLPPTPALKRLAKIVDDKIGSQKIGDRHYIERSTVCLR